MEVVPENTYERIFVILTILSAIIVFSSFLSSLAAAVAVFRRKREEQQINNDNLDKFFQENHVSVDLANRIQGFLRMQRTRRGAVHRIHQSAVPQLQQLSEPIKEQLAFEIFMPVISVYPMLRTITSLSESCVVAICLGAASQLSTLAFQEVFHMGSACKAMYFVVAGEIAYFRGCSTKPMVDSQRLKATVLAGSWICEYVLFVAWEHRGLMATTGMPCELVLLDATAFQTAVQQWPRLMCFCRDYALMLLADRELNEENLTDLAIEKNDAQMLVQQSMVSV